MEDAVDDWIAVQADNEASSWESAIERFYPPACRDLE